MLSNAHVERDLVPFNFDCERDGLSPAISGGDARQAVLASDRDLFDRNRNHSFANGAYPFTAITCDRHQKFEPIASIGSSGRDFIKAFQRMRTIILRLWKSGHSRDGRPNKRRHQSQSHRVSDHSGILSSFLGLVARPVKAKRVEWSGRELSFRV